MIKKLNESVDPKVLIQTDNNYSEYTSGIFFIVAIAIILFMIVASQLIYGWLKQYKPFHFLNNNVIKKTLIIITGIFTIIAAPTAGAILAGYNEVKSELKHGKPYYRDVNITGTIDDISNGSNKSSQEIRFTHDGKNYYVTIPSDISARPLDKIHVSIHRQLVDNKSKYNNLNDTLFFKTTDFKNSVEIHHDGRVNKTHLFDVKEERNKLFAKREFD